MKKSCKSKLTNPFPLTTNAIRIIYNPPIKINKKFKSNPSKKFRLKGSPERLTADCTATDDEDDEEPPGFDAEQAEEGNALEH